MKKKWKSSASIATLKKRAKIIFNIRRFFYKNKILEIETPMLSRATVTDINLHAFNTEYISIDKKKIPLWLITSPEYHMKRLLAEESIPIYQICHSFRNTEYGRYHNPEFTILEWYEPFYSMNKFIKKIDYFLQRILNCDQSNKISYRDLFIKHLQIDPLSTNIEELREKSIDLKIDNITENENDIHKIIELLFALKIEPHLGLKKPLFVYHFPVAQAALAKVNSKDVRISDRFEIFFKGMELGNGFYELTDYLEQKNRFILDNKKRALLNYPIQAIDFIFLDALKHGLPSCSGIAIGLDRLIMLALYKKNISQVIAFPLDRC